MVSGRHGISALAEISGVQEGLLCLHVLVYTNVYAYWFHAALKPICEEKSNQRLNLIFESTFL